MCRRIWYAPGAMSADLLFVRRRPGERRDRGDDAGLGQGRADRARAVARMDLDRDRAGAVARPVGDLLRRERLVADPAGGGDDERRSPRRSSSSSRRRRRRRCFALDAAPRRRLQQRVAGVGADRRRPSVIERSARQDRRTEQIAGDVSRARSNVIGRAGSPACIDGVADRVLGRRARLRRRYRRVSSERVRPSTSGRATGAR